MQANRPASFSSHLTAENEIIEKERPVYTDVSPEGFREKQDDAMRAVMQKSYNLSYLPAAVYNIYGHGDPGWQNGTDLILRSKHLSASEQQHGFIFFHGAGQTSDYPDMVKFTKMLLDAFPGRAYLPQALPKFKMTMFAPKHIKDPVQIGVNAFQHLQPGNISLPPYSGWVSMFRPAPFSCYANPAATENMAWAPVTKALHVRVRAVIRNWIHKGIAASNIYLLGFSDGAPFAQQVLVGLASEENLDLGGAVGFDGADVDQIASQAAFENLNSNPNILYFLYSMNHTGLNNVTPMADCLMSYPNLDLQLYQKQSNNDVLHAVYLQLYNATQLWLKKAKPAIIRQAWQLGLAQIIESQPM